MPDPGREEKRKRTANHPTQLQNQTRGWPKAADKLKAGFTRLGLVRTSPTNSADVFHFLLEPLTQPLLHHALVI